ncbi:MAG: family 20 glycosylhydrolase, partial [Bacteroidota bacterium]
MNYYTIFRLSGLLALLLVFSCDTSPPAVPMDMGEAALIPHPVSLRATSSSFQLGPDTKIYAEESVVGLAERLAEYLRPATGYALPVEPMTEATMAEGIQVLLSADLEAASEEAYELSVEQGYVRLQAKSEVGLFRGFQTIRQLLPASIEAGSPQTADWRIATGMISDYPAYEYRGAMLDVARHFFTVEEVKQYLDYLAAYKFNALHLHLTDDQGWRI